MRAVCESCGRPFIALDNSAFFICGFCTALWATQPQPLKTARRRQDRRQWTPEQVDRLVNDLAWLPVTKVTPQ